jgi:2-aminoadipate transaminase
LNPSILARRALALSAGPAGKHFPFEFGPEMVLFDSGFASPAVLPDLTRFAAQALTRYREEALQYSPSQGHPELRQWLATWMNEDGCNLAADEVLIVNGAKNGLDLICRLLLEEGDAIVVTAPMYFTAIPIFRSHGAQFIEIGQDAEGMRVDVLEEALRRRAQHGQPAPKFIYNVPDFHNPIGVALSRARRVALVELAARRSIAVVEDNPYRRVRFEGDSLPTLKSLDRGGWVLHVGTFSKLIAPGLRIGWVAADAEAIARLRQLKADGGTNPFVQRLVLEFCRSADFAGHVRRVQDTYRVHRDCMVAALRKHLPQAAVDVPEGGYYLWLTFGEGCDGDALARRAAEAGVNLIAGSRFFAGAGQVPRHHIRLSYSYASPQQIEAGIVRLAGAYRQQQGG